MFGLDVGGVRGPAAVAGRAGAHRSDRCRTRGVNHVLRDDPTDNVANYAKKDPLSPQLISALDTFLTK